MDSKNKPVKSRQETAQGSGQGSTHGSGQTQAQEAKLFSLGIFRGARRQFVIDKRSQYTFLGYVLVVGVLFTTYHSLTSILWQSMLGPAQSLAEAPIEQAWMLVLLVAFGAAVILWFAVLGTNYLTNKLVGPIWRLQQHMKKALNDGDYSPIEFRNKDEFPELAETYNQLLERMRLLEEANRKSGSNRGDMSH